MKTLIIAIFTLFVFDSETNEPIVGAEVINTKTNISYYTDFDGKVQLCDDSSTYIITSISYKDTLITSKDTVINLYVL